MKKESILKGGIGSLYARFCSASVLGMVGISLYILADTFFIANGIGQTALAALNIAIPTYSVVAAVGLLLGIGCATCYSVERGKGNHEKANSYYAFGIIAGVVAGVVFMVIGLTLPGKLALMLGATPETVEYCTTYLQVILTYAPAFILNQIFLAFARNIGKPNIAMISMVAGSIFNIVMDYVAVYVLGMGMFGAALATAFSPLVGMAISIPCVAAKKSGLKLKGTKPGIALMSRVLAGGTSSFIVELSVGIAVFILNAVMIRLAGNVGVAAYGIIANVTIVAYSIFTGMGQALQPIVSVNYGAGQTMRIKKSFLVAGGTALITGILLYVLGTGFAQEITAIFNSENDPQLAEITMNGIKLYFLAYIPMGINVVMSYFFQSILHMKNSVIISLLRGLIIISLAALTLSYIFGMNGVWISALLAEAGALAYGVISYVSWFKKGHVVEIPVI